MKSQIQFRQLLIIAILFVFNSTSLSHAKPQDKNRWNKKYDINLKNEDYFEITDKVDLLLMSHVLEHFNNVNNVLKKAAEITDVGGVFFFEVPNSPSITEVTSATLDCYFNTTHTYNFTYRSIIELVNNSDFEIAVSNSLRDAGFETEPQVGVAGFYIDLAVIDPGKPGRFLMGIECDGATYHSAKSARDRDRLRQSVLERLGWRIHRIWSTDYFKNPQAEILPLIRELNMLKTDVSIAEEEEPEVEMLQNIKVNFLSLNSLHQFNRIYTLNIK
mgnify:CR=1 FL=1